MPPFEIRYTDSLLAPFVHFFLLGDTGTGKTVAASSFPYPIFLVPKNEASIVTLRGMRRGDGSPIPYIEIETPTDMDNVLTWLEGQCRQAGEFARAGDMASAWAVFPYQTIVTESLSHYCDLIIEALISGGSGKSAGKMDQQKWGQLGAHLRNLHSRIRNLPVHAVFTALAQVKESESSNTVVGGPLMSGAMAYKLPSACDAIGYCEVIAGPKPIFRTHFTRYKLFPARVRVPPGVVFPPHVDNLRWDNVKGYFGH